MSNHKIKLNELPDVPGIYLFYNLDKELIYVGKATSLKSRVSSYFRIKKITRPIEGMMHEVADIKWKETGSVLEAIIEESIYIKNYQPKYNVLGKDNKSWNYIVITKDLYPIVTTKREHELMAMSQKNKKAIKQFSYIFGPYPGLNGKAAMNILRRLFHISFCQMRKKTRKQENNKVDLKPCFYYQMGQCLGVCTGEISAKEYKAKVIRPLVLFLNGKKKLLIKNLERDMSVASKKEDFEEAGRIRDQLKSLTLIHDIALLNKSFFQPEAGDSDKKSRVLRIEGYDISNLGMTGKVGSMVVFDATGPIKSQYRKFKIKTVEGQSDVDCLEEVLRRRFKHSIDWPKPDVILIDGGLPQVNRAVKIIQEYKLDIPVIGIAKGPARKKNEFVFGIKTREFVKWVNEHQTLLIQTRDEAHRFAITYQRSLRKI